MTTTGRAWRALSLMVTLASLAFLVWAIAGTGVLSDPAWRDPRLLGRVALAGGVYAGALLFVVAGWLALVRSASDDWASDDWASGGGAGKPLAARAGFRIYGLSQLYKYLPSNLLHYVGRHAALRRIGIGHLAAALGGLGEIALLISAALVVAAATGSLSNAVLADRFETPLLAALGMGVAGAAAIALALPRLRRHPRTAALTETMLAPPVRRAAAFAFACYLLFFACSGAAFAIVASGAGAAPAGFLPLAAIWTSAWVLGFVVPGAPGGLGVREAVLIAGLAPALGLDGAALAALAMRLATVIGDLLLAAAAWLAGTDPVANRRPDSTQ